MADVASVVITLIGCIHEIRVAREAVKQHRYQSTRLLERAERFHTLLSTLQGRPDLHEAVRKFLNPLHEALQKARTFLRLLGKQSRVAAFLNNRNTTYNFKELNRELDRCAADICTAITLMVPGLRLEPHVARDDEEDDYEELYNRLLDHSERLRMARDAQQAELVEHLGILRRQLEEMHEYFEGNNCSGASEGRASELHANVGAVLARNEETKPAVEIVSELQQEQLRAYDLGSNLEFVNLQTTGYGTFGEVYRAEVYSAGAHKLPASVALKHLGRGEESMAEGEAEQRRLQHEVLLQAKTQCDYVVKIFGFTTLGHERIGGDHFCLVMECAELGNLRELLKVCSGRAGTVRTTSPQGTALEARLAVPIILAMLLDIARGIEHIHEQCVMHRDIKPGNILIFPGFHMKISDFGVSKHRSNLFSNDMSTTANVGTLAYMAPEVIADERGGRQAKYNYTADVYSFGVALHELCHKAFSPLPQGRSPPHNVELPAVFPRELDLLRLRCLDPVGRRRYGRGSAMGDLMSTEIEAILRATGGDPRRPQAGADVRRYLAKLEELCRALQQGRIASFHRPSGPARPLRESLVGLRSALTVQLETNTGTIGSAGQRAAEAMLRQDIRSLPELCEAYRVLGSEVLFRNLGVPLGIRSTLEAFLQDTDGATRASAARVSAARASAARSSSARDSAATVPAARVFTELPPPPPPPPLSAATSVRWVPVAERPTELRPNYLDGIAPGPVQDAMRRLANAAGDPALLIEAFDAVPVRLPADILTTDDLSVHLDMHRREALPFVDRGVTHVARWAVQRHGESIELTRVILRVLSAEAYHLTPVRGSWRPPSDGREAVDTVVTAMRRHNSDDEVQRQSLGTLRLLLLSAPSVATWCVQAGASSQIASAMKRHRHDAGLQRDGCLVVQRLAAGADDTCDALMEAGVGAAVLGTLQAHPADAEVESRACAALAELCHASDTRAAAVLGAGGKAVILDVIGRHDGTSSVLASAFGALRSLAGAGRECQKELVDDGVISLVATAMHRHFAHSEVQRQGCGLLSKLVSVLGRGEATQTTTHRVANLVVRAMHFHEAVAEVQYEAFAVIGGLVHGGDAERRKYLLDSLVAARIAAAMRIHRAHAEVQREACWVIRYLVRDSDADKDAFLNHGVAALIVGAMRAHADLADLEHHACGLIATFARGASPPSKRPEALMDAGVVDAIVIAMRSHADVREVQEKAAWALEYLAKGSPSRQAALRRANVEALLLAARSAHQENLTAETRIQAALNEIQATDPGFRFPNFRRSGGRA